MSAILTDPVSIRIFLVAVGFVAAAWAAGHMSTNGRA